MPLTSPARRAAPTRGSGLTQTAPEGLVPLDSLSPLRRGECWKCRLPRLRGGRPLRGAAVLRRQRQRDLSLWTPFLRCGGVSAGNAAYLACAAGGPCAGQRSYADSARGTCPSGLPFSAAAGNGYGHHCFCGLPRPPKRRRAGWVNAVGFSVMYSLYFVCNAIVTKSLHVSS